MNPGCTGSRARARPLPRARGPLNCSAFRAMRRSAGKNRPIRVAMLQRLPAPGVSPDGAWQAAGDLGDAARVDELAVTGTYGGMIRSYQRGLTKCIYR